MKTKQTNFRLSIEAQVHLEQICNATGMNQTAAVEIALAEKAKDFPTWPWPKMTPYILHIYTYPACVGTPPLVRYSFHDTPDEALEHLRNQTIPFAYACLQNSDGAPVNFDGRKVIGDAKWETIRGENKNHPAYDELQKDVEYLIAETIRRYDGKVGMVAIAQELLQERHPEVCGWGEIIARKAADISCSRQ